MLPLQASEVGGVRCLIIRLLTSNHNILAGFRANVGIVPSNRPGSPRQNS
jgi:hypothetical protein